jgi:flagellar hook-associated protein 3 FlgL
MLNRITFTQINDVVQRNLSSNYKKLAGLQEQLSSGKRINRPSDAPVEISTDLKLRSTINGMNQYKRNTNDGLSYLGVVDSTLLNANNIFQKVREQAVLGDNGTNTDQQRSSMNDEAKQLLYQLVSVSNTTYKGDYVFSGDRIDEPPFKLTRGTASLDILTGNGNGTAFATGVDIPLYDVSAKDSLFSQTGNPRSQRIVPSELKIPGMVEGTDFKVNYSKGTINFMNTANVNNSAAIVPGGIQVSYEYVRKNEKDMSGSNDRLLDDNVKVGLNLSPDRLFGSDLEVDAFQAVIGLMQGLHTNKPNEINGSITQIDERFAQFISAEAVIGSKYNQLSESSDRLDNKTIETTRILSKIEDLDFAEAISNFQLSDAVYKASLQSAAKVLQPTLASFL